MPEGHVTHRLASEITERFTRRVVRVSSPQGRFSAGAELLDGRRVVDAESVGKHLFIRFTGQHWVHIHLGLYGKFTFGETPVPEPIGLIRLRMVNKTSWCDLRGANTCTVIGPDEKAQIEARLGDDPLQPGADGEHAWERISRSRAPIATLLMDQSVIAGSGNIFRAEILFRAGMDPFREGRSLTREEWDGLWTDFVDLMAYAYEHGRIDTVRPDHEPEAMDRPPRVDKHGGEVYVYRRSGQPCHVCGDLVRRTDHAGRHLFWCANCQSG